MRRFGLATLVALYVLILAGGVVRSTGAGMGCPDWPHCYGNWVPPADETALPPDYRTIYSEHRHEKVVRFAKYLDALGMTETARSLWEESAGEREAGFSAARAWTEYFNRLVGVVVGLMTLGLFIRSISFWQTKRMVTTLAFLALVLVAFQGWLGSIVVATNLTPWTVTLHMVLALGVVALLVAVIELAGVFAGPVLPGSSAVLLGLCITALFIQILFGTVVREHVDLVAAAIPDRGEWVGRLGGDFLRHRSFSWAVLLLHLALAVKLWRGGSDPRIFVIPVSLVVLSMITGGLMAYLDIPAYLQPVHLVLAAVMFGLEFALFLQWTRAMRKRTT